MTSVTRRFAKGSVQVAVIVALVALCSRAQRSATLNPLPPDERDALVALYKATGGSQWGNNSGWLGAAGTECEWYGVTCDYPAHIQNRTPFVVSLELSNNKLVGAIPPELGRLNGLEWLSLVGNRLTGTVPESLIQRWLAGPLHIAAEAHLLTAVSKIDYESNASSLLCARQRIIFSSDGKALIYTTRCSSREGRNTYCEEKKGRVTWDEFARLAWTMENVGFFGLQAKYSRNVTDVGFENTRLTKSGKNVEVSNYAEAGPVGLWEVQRAIEGVAANIEVEKIGRCANCPRW